MSGGYTPLFNSALDGTLYGRWPHSGIWFCLLSQCDRYGRIDVVPRLLAAKFGVDEDVLLACIEDFQKPDPGSRTGDLEGRRLELLDPVNRNWGWRVINHGLYRERARKAAYDAERTESGDDAERKRRERESREKMLSRDVPTRPDMSRDVPLSDSDANANANANANAYERGDARASGSAPKTSPLSRTHDGQDSIIELESERYARDRARFVALKADYPPGAQREDWKHAFTYAKGIVTSSRGSWEQLHEGVRRYRKHIQRTGSYVMNPAKFFSASDHPWAQSWGGVRTASQSKPEARESVPDSHTHLNGSGHK